MHDASSPSWSGKPDGSQTFRHVVLTLDIYRQKNGKPTKEAKEKTPVVVKLFYIEQVLRRRGSFQKGVNNRFNAGLVCDVETIRGEPHWWYVSTIKTASKALEEAFEATVGLPLLYAEEWIRGQRGEGTYHYGERDNGEWE